jgi:rSAM/selenodomain-associated transferase 1
VTADARPLLVFARAPVAGSCKTRLIPRLGPGGAASVHRQLTAQTLRCALEADASVELWCAPDVRHPFFSSMRTALGVGLRRQSSGDLGRRMAMGLRDALARGASAAVIVGTDCAALTAADIDAAFAALAGGADFVLQPSSDGGFVLIGARVNDPQVLRGVDWSSGSELAQTRARIERRGHRLALLRELWDVDRAADWRRARQEGLLR